MESDLTRCGECDGTMPVCHEIWLGVTRGLAEAEMLEGR